MAELPREVKAGEPISASWLNNLAVLSSQYAGIKGKGYASSTGVAFAAGRSFSSIEGFAKNTAELAHGLHDPAAVVPGYKGPAYGSETTGEDVSIDYFTSIIPANSWIYYRQIDDKIYGSLFECPPPPP